MASNLGTVFVEIFLDDRIYKEKLSQIQPNMEATAKGLETSWRGLGVKTNEYFDNSRKAAENAYSLISKSGKYAADDILRAEEAKNAKIQSLNEQQFGKQTSLIESMKSHWIAATAAIAAAVGIMYKAWDLARIGASYEEQRGILDNLATKYSTTAAAIVDAMATASGGMVSNVDLMKISLGGLAKGLDPSQMIALADAAKILADVTGVNVKTALEDVTQALETGRVKGLKQYLGTSLDLGVSFGDLESKLTAAEKSQAMFNLVIIKATELQGQQKIAVDETADKMDRMEASYNNATLALGRFLKGIVAAIYDAPGKFAAAAQSVDLLTGETVKAAVAVTDYADCMGDEVAASEYIIKSRKESNEQLKKEVQARKDNEEQIKKNEAAAKKAAEDEKKLLEEGTAGWVKYADAIIKENDDMYSAIAKLQIEKNKEEEKLLEKAPEEWGKYADAVIKENDDMYETLAKIQIEKNKDELDRIKDRGDAEREIYKDLRGYEDQYYAASAVLIAAQAKKYKDLGVSEVAIAAWVAAETEKNDIKKAKSGDDFVDGINAGYKEMQKNAMTFGKAGYEIFNTFAESSKTAVSDILFQAIKTGTVDMKTVWDNFCGSMLRKLTDTIADMVMTAIAKDIMMMFKANWTADSSNVLGIINGAINLWNSFTGEAYGGIIPGKARVSGDSYANDRVHVLASPGEYFMPRTAVTAETLPALEYIRETKSLPAFAEGGQVYSARNGGFIPGYAEGGYIDLGAAYLRRYKDVAADPFFVMNPWEHWQRYGQYEGRTWFVDPAPVYTYTGGYPMLYGSVLGRRGIGRGSEEEKNAGIDDATIWDEALYQAYNRQLRRMRFDYAGAEDDSDAQTFIKDWAECYLSMVSGEDFGFGNKWYNLWNQGFGDADIMGEMKKPSGQYRRFYQDATYDDLYASASVGWLGEFVGQVAKWASIAIISYCSAYVGGGLLGPYIGAAAGTGAGAAVGTYILTGGNWQAAIIAGITAAALSAISSYFTDAGASADTSPYLDDGEFQAWKADPSYTEALNSDVGRGSTAAWWDNVMDSAGKFVVKGLVKNVIKIGAGHLGLDQSNQGHATFGFDSMDDHGVFASLAPLMDAIAPKTTALNLSFAGGGGYPALGGLDYVPRDNFRIRAHEGEAVLNKQDAQEWRGGGGRPSIGEIKIYLDGEEIKGRMRIVADGVVVDRNRSGINPTMRVYQ